jgi:hypothetical protein
MLLTSQTTLPMPKWEAILLMDYLILLESSFSNILTNIVRGNEQTSN